MGLQKPVNLTVRDGEGMVVELLGGDGVDSDEALILKFPTGSEISIWSDGLFQIQTAQFGITEHHLATVAASPF